MAAMIMLCAGCAFVPPRVPAPEKPAPRDETVEEPTASRTPSPDENRILITIHDEDFVFEIADDDNERAIGLSNRKEIAKHGGMIFVYPSAEQRRFWMYECLVPIDIAYLDADGRIVALHEMPIDPPQRADEDEWDYEYRLKRYPSHRPAQFALEFKAGTLDRLQLEVGERIEFDRALLVERAKRNAIDFDW